MAAAEDAFYQLCGEMPGGVPAPSSTPALRTQLHAPLTTNASAAMGANTSVGSYSPACASGHVFSVTVPHEAVGQVRLTSVANCQQLLAIAAATTTTTAMCVVGNSHRLFLLTTANVTLGRMRCCP